MIVGDFEEIPGMQRAPESPNSFFWAVNWSRRKIRSTSAESCTRRSTRCRLATTHHRRKRFHSSRQAQDLEPIGVKLDAAAAATKRALAAWENARERSQEAEAGVAAEADTLVSAFEAEETHREQARNENTKEANESGSRVTTAAELRETLCSVIDSVEKAWPPVSMSTEALQEAMTAAISTLHCPTTRTCCGSTKKKQGRTRNRTPKNRKRKPFGSRRFTQVELFRLTRGEASCGQLMDRQLTLREPLEGGGSDGSDSSCGMNV